MPVFYPIQRSVVQIVRSIFGRAGEGWDYLLCIRSMNNSIWWISLFHNNNNTNKKARTHTKTVNNNKEFSFGSRSNAAGQHFVSTDAPFNAASDTAGQYAWRHAHANRLFLSFGRWTAADVRVTRARLVFHPAFWAIRLKLGRLTVWKHIVI